MLQAQGYDDIEVIRQGLDENDFKAVSRVLACLASMLVPFVRARCLLRY